MEFCVKENKNIGEKYYYIKHKSGLSVYVVPKKMGTSYAAFATKFGSIDNVFNLDGRRIELPEGVAHFLEHKMFENSDGRDTFELYAKTGANANAYTSNNRTVYLFSAADNIYESLEILLGFVRDPYFTDKTVEKEQGIIGQEIKMYDDSPEWQLYFGMLQALYHNNPLKIDIAGTVESIAKITPEILFDAYNTFYNLENMVLVVAGDVEKEKVVEVCDKILKFEQTPKTQRIYPDEPNEVNLSEISKKMTVSMPMFSVGIKDNNCPLSGNALAKKRATYGIALDLMFSKSSPFYERLVDMGLIDSSFSFSFEAHETFGYAELSGNSNDPQGVYKEVLKEIAYYKENGFDNESFERIKRANYAHILRLFDSTDEIANEMVSAVFDGICILDYPEICSSVTLSDVENLVKNEFCHTALSQIYPL